MNCIIERDGTDLVARLQGSLDIKTSPAVEQTIEAKLDGVTVLTLDMADVDFVSSMGLRLLLKLEKRMSKQGVMYVRGIDSEGPVYKLFEETGFKDILTLV